MNFSRLSGGEGGAFKLDLVLFIFTGIDFLGAIKNEGRRFGSTGFLEGRERAY